MRRRKSLISGATGYVGSMLARELVQRGEEVHLLVRKSSSKKRLSVDIRSCCVHVYDGSIRSLICLMKKIKPDTIFHLAAYAPQEHKPEDLDRIIESNITLGTQLAEVASRCNVRSFINTGTFWQFWGGGSYNPVNLYAATKQALEDILRFYTETSKLRAATLYLFDVYGPGDPRPKLFSFLKKSYLNNKPIAMTPGKQLVDITHISDVIAAFLQARKLLERKAPLKNSRFMVSSGKRISLKKLIAIYKEVTGRSLRIQWGGKSYRFREIMKPFHGKPLPGWKPKIGLKKGLREMVQSEATSRGGYHS